MPLTGRSLPLLLTILVHLVLAWLYLTQRAAEPGGPSAPQRFFVALVARPVPRAPQRPLRPPPMRTPLPRATPVHAVRQPAAPAALPVAPIEAAPLPAQPASAGDILERAKRDVGKIDRALRGGVSAVPAVRPDTPQARFEAMMESAFIDRSKTMRVDHYESADGVIIERITRGGSSKCYMSGTVNFVPGILHDSSKPQSVSCPPAGSGWTRK